MRGALRCGCSPRALGSWVTEYVTERRETQPLLAPQQPGSPDSPAPRAPVPGGGRALAPLPRLCFGRRSGAGHVLVKDSVSPRGVGPPAAEGATSPRGTCRRRFQSTGQRPGPAAGTTDDHLPEGVGKKGKKSGERDQMSLRSLPAPCSAPWRWWSGFGVRNGGTLTAKVLSNSIPCSLPRPPARLRRFGTARPGVPLLRPKLLHD